jgi:probable HAF family extracellular repeat protein
MARSITAAVGLVVLAGTCVVAVAQPYPVTGIGNLSGGPSIAWGISSASGQPVVGETDTNNSLTYRACTFTTSMLAVNTGSGPGGFFTPKTAFRINSNPATLIHVGSGQSASLSTRAFRTNGGVTFEIGTVLGLQNSEAHGVNFGGTVVGTSWASNSSPGNSSGSWGFKWVPTSPSSDTGAMNPIALHAAYDVNDSGIAVGVYNGQAARSDINTLLVSSLGSLGGTMAGAALANNNAGAAVGFSSAASASSFRHAFRWTSGGGMQDIHPVVLGATAESFAHDINSAGVVVGKFHGTGTGSNGHAFIYNPASGIWKDLNTWLPSGSGWVLESAEGISDGNCIVGRGKRNGQTEGFKMCVVPPVALAPPCGGLPLDPIAMAAQSSCPGVTAVFEFDPTPVGGGPGNPVEVEWDFSRAPRAPAGVTHEYHRVVDGLNIDSDTGEPLFIAAIGGGGTQGGATSLSITPIQSPVPGGAGGWAVRALVRGPCDTRYTVAAMHFVAAADLGRQGGLAGGDGLYDNNDFVVFIDKFFTADPLADLGVQGGLLGSDGQFDNNDFVVFIDQFFHACM